MHLSTSRRTNARHAGLRAGTYSKPRAGRYPSRVRARTRSSVRAGTQAVCGQVPKPRAGKYSKRLAGRYQVACGQVPSRVRAGTQAARGYASPSAARQRHPKGPTTTELAEIVWMHQHWAKPPNHDGDCQGHRGAALSNQDAPGYRMPVMVDTAPQARHTAKTAILARGARSSVWLPLVPPGPAWSRPVPPGPARFRLAPHDWRMVRRIAIYMPGVGQVFLID